MVSSKSAPVTSSHEADSTGSPAATALPSLAQLHLQLDATSRIAVERGVEISRAMNQMTHHNLDTMLALTKVATSGFGEIAAHLSEFAVNQASAGTRYGRDVAALSSPSEAAAFHEAHTRRLSEAMIGEVSALSEKLTAVSSTMMETLQSRSAAALDKSQAVLRAATPAAGSAALKHEDKK